MEAKLPHWLEWAREIQSLAQTGYYYSDNEYQRERYQRLSELAAEIFSTYADLAYEPLLEDFQAHIGYSTPRVDVRGAVFKDGKLLLVRERDDGGWTMPGGWADVGDLPSASAEREVWEEAGLNVKAYKVVGVYDANRLRPLSLYHAYKIVFLCKLLDGEPRPSRETSEIAFFGPDEIPTRLSGERMKVRHVLDAFAAYAHLDFETVFD